MYMTVYISHNDRLLPVYRPVSTLSSGLVCVTVSMVSGNCMSSRCLGREIKWLKKKLYPSRTEFIMHSFLHNFHPFFSWNSPHDFHLIFFSWIVQFLVWWITMLRSCRLCVVVMSFHHFPKRNGLPYVHEGPEGFGCTPRQEGWIFAPSDGEVARLQRWPFMDHVNPYLSPK